MQIRLLLTSRRWQARYPQAGSKNGWSAWQDIDRSEALNFIELGWDFERFVDM